MKKPIILGSVVFAYFVSFVGMLSAGDATLTLDDNAGSSSFVVQDVDKTTQFKVNSDGQGYFAGNVGIGLSSNIDNKVHIFGGTGHYGLKLEVNDSSDGSSQLVFVSGSEPQFGQGSVIQLNTTSHNTEPNALLIYNRTNGNIQFPTNNTERMRITNSGNVGIGTTNLSSKLTVAGTIESTSGGVKFPVWTTQTTAASGSATIADGSVTQTKLKTATGEVSRSVTGDGSTYQHILPGGSYGFYPQVRSAAGNNIETHATIIGPYARSQAWPTSYTTNISFYSGSGQSDTVYAQQRYVTASGQDHWLFLLLDKDTKDIIGAYSAPDHPCYGNGCDPDKVQHPLGSYDQEKHEIVIVDNETIKQLKQDSSSTGKSLLTLVNEEYKVNKKKAEPYVPLHSGKFLTQVGKQVMQMVGKLPDYIKVRKLEKFSASEKSEREAQREEEQEEYEQKKQKKEKDRARVMKKLKELGLTEDEIKALF